MSEDGKNEDVLDYWQTFYATCHCTICGNSGIIDSRGICTPGGLSVGRLNWCICPNGQALRMGIEGGPDVLIERKGPDDIR